MRDNKALLPIIIMTISLWSVSPVYAQIKPITTHYNYLKETYNPAFYGVEKQYKFATNYRAQWVKLNGAPQTFNILSSFHLPRVNSGVGLNVTYDRIGAFSTTTLQVGYNYLLSIKKKLIIGIGAQAGFEFTNLDGIKLITPDGNYNSGIEHNDDVLNQSIIKTFRPLMNVGISLNSKYLNVGIAYLNAINNNLKLDGQNANLSTKLGGVLQTNINSKIKLPKDLYLIPALNLQTDFVNLQTDIQLLVGYQYFGEIGLNVRGFNKQSFESVSPIIKLTPIKNVGFGIIYSYDINLNSLSVANRNTHEVTLFYQMPSKNTTKLPKYTNNPRFL